MRSFEIAPPEQISSELEGAPVDKLVGEAISWLEDRETEVDDMALARMFIERGYSEEMSYWIVREAEVRRAPGELPAPIV